MRKGLVTHSWVRVRQLPNLLEAPENRVTRERTVTILLGHSHCTESLLVNSQVTSTGVQQVEDYPGLAPISPRASVKSPDNLPEPNWTYSLTMSSDKL